MRIKYCLLLLCMPGLGFSTLIHQKSPAQARIYKLLNEKNHLKNSSTNPSLERMRESQQRQMQIKMHSTQAKQRAVHPGH